MKKISNNNKFRNNSIYSLNYKFDSVSSAGKLNGTALDLIKKYNELAKEAHNNGDYVQMEVFRQYAEHYRKIVTEINERKNQNRENNAEQNTSSASPENAENKSNEAPAEETAAEQTPASSSPENNLVETEAAQPTVENQTGSSTPSATTETKPIRRKRNFTVVEVKETANSQEAATAEQPAKPLRRTIRRKKTEEAAAETAVSAQQ